MFSRCVLSQQNVINRFAMKLFESSNTAVIKQCRCFFRIELPSVQLKKRFEKFLANAANDDNVVLTLNDCEHVLHCFLVKAISVISVFFSFYVFSTILVNKDDQNGTKQTRAKLQMLY